MNVNGSPGLLGAGALQNEQHAGLVECGPKARRALEGTSVELVGIFEGNFCLVSDWLRHFVSTSGGSMATAPARPLDYYSLGKRNSLLQALKNPYLHLVSMTAWPRILKIRRI